jgi:hypothetical protein
MIAFCPAVSISHTQIFTGVALQAPSITQTSPVGLHLQKKPGGVTI